MLYNPAVIIVALALIVLMLIGIVMENHRYNKRMAKERADLEQMRAATDGLRSAPRAFGANQNRPHSAFRRDDPNYYPQRLDDEGGSD